MPSFRTSRNFPVKSLPAARRIAALTVYATLYKNQDLQSALDQILQRESFSPRDRGLATELAYGYIRNRNRADFLVTSFLKSPDTLPPHLLLVLGLAGYELAFLDKIPTYATVNWAVEWIKKNLSARLAGLGNAVLRKIAGLGEQTRGQAFFRQDHPDEVTFLSRYYSCPPWIIELWLQSYGAQTTEALLRASISQPPLGLRISSEHAHDFFTPDLEKILLRHQGNALALTTSPDNLGELLAQKVVTRQSFAAQTAMEGLEPATWPTPIWDACCGRGGKSLALADKNIGPLWASDVHAGRLRGFLQECLRTGAPIPLFRASAKDTPPFGTAPRTILLDVPCSGLGVLSRRPDSKWKREPRDVAALVKTQQAILKNAWDVIPPGGLVVYLTCTLNPAENQDQIAWLCREEEDAVVVKEYETGSNEDVGEFFYGAVIRKTDRTK